MTTIGLIQARMGSSRLPGKVMKPLAGRPLVWHIADRLRRTRGVEALVLATGRASANDPLAAWGEDNGLIVDRVSDENDILTRLRRAFDIAGADTMVKVNADCPMPDPALMAAGLDAVAARPSADAATTKLRPTVPLAYSVEILRRRPIDALDGELRAREDRELVAKYIFDRPERFDVIPLDFDVGSGWADLDLTVDTPADYELVARIFDDLYGEDPNFGLAAVQDWVRRHPLPATAYLAPPAAPAARAQGTA